MQIKIIKLIQTAPFLILMIVLINTMIFKYVNNYAIENKYLISAILLIFNAILYFYNFKFGILITSGLLLFGIFNILNFFISLETEKYSLRFIFKISTPAYDPRLLLIFIFSLIVNFRVHSPTFARHQLTNSPIH